MFKNIYNNKVVLVTGNTGFKGSWLTTWLLNLGAKVVGLSDKVPTQPSMFELLDLQKKIKHYTADVNDFQKVSGIIQSEQPNFIFHLAAQAIVSKSYEDPLTTIHTNIIGTTNLLEALRIYNKPCTAVFITSDKCYENVEWTWGYRENDRLGGKDLYSASKAGAEVVFYAYYNSFFKDRSCPVKLVTGRAGNVIGGGDWAINRVVPDCVRAWSVDKPVVIRNPGSTRPWQHVLEPISGYMTLATKLSINPLLTGNSYNFGPVSDQTFTVKKLISTLADHWSFKSNINNIDIQEVPGFHEAGLLKLNCDKALNDLNWKPVLQFSDAARLTSSWYDSYYHNKEIEIFDYTSAQIKEYIDLASNLKLEWTYD